MASNNDPSHFCLLEFHRALQCHPTRQLKLINCININTDCHYVRRLVATEKVWRCPKTKNISKSPGPITL